MLDGDHDIDMCQKISEKVLVATFAALHKACLELFRNNSGNISLLSVCKSLKHCKAQCFIGRHLVENQHGYPRSKMSK